MNQRGFTLLEIILSLGVIAILAGVAIPLYQSFQVKNDLDIAQNTVAQSFRRAQTQAASGDGDSAWGAKIQNGSITVFQGSSYAARNSAYDETFDLPSTITISGLGEVVFAKLTGIPSTTGTVTLTSSNNQTATVAINAKGGLTW